VTDQDIIDGLARGEAAAGEELLTRYAVPLARYFAVSLPDPQTAPDAAQEVFLRLLAAAREGRLRRIASLQGLVFTTARRLALDARRQWSRRPKAISLDSPIAEDGGPTFADCAPDTAPDARERAAHAEQLQLVATALLGLDELTREVIVLRHLEGVASKDVAEMLGVAEGTVWSRLHRGLDHLRRILAPRHANEGQTQAGTTTEKRQKGRSPLA